MNYSKDKSYSSKNLQQKTIKSNNESHGEIVKKNLKEKKCRYPKYICVDSM